MVTDIITFHTLIILRLEMIHLFYSVQYVSTFMSTLYIHDMVCTVLLIYRHGCDFALFIDRIRI